MVTSQVRKTLSDIGAISDDDVVLYAPRTRDRIIPVFRDSKTGVIFLDDFYPGDDEYVEGAYHQCNMHPDLDDIRDTRRRATDFHYLYHDRDIVDFGCGAGHFLRHVAVNAREAVGVELQSDYRESLTSQGFTCVRRLGDVQGEFDTGFLFHVLEHLPDPLEMLTELRNRLKPKGVIVVEVPSANDLLISALHHQPFIDFTLWSFHLVLHTRDSLAKLLAAAGFTHITITGVQRFGIANHLSWLTTAQPTGNAGPLQFLETPDLRQAYESALARANSTDTLVAVARLSD